MSAARHSGTRRLAASLATIFAALVTQAGDWYVAEKGSDANPGTELEPFATLTNAVARASDDDTIHVAAGNYDMIAEVVVEKAVAIVGAGSEATHLEKISGIRPFTLNNEKAILRGVHITDAVGTAWGPARGGAILLTLGTVDQCLIEKCYASNTQSGGGIYMTGGLVSRTTVRNCDCVGYGAYANGVYMSGGTLDNCLIVGNGKRSHYGKYGGGVTMSGKTCIVANCTVADNYVDSGSGGGIYRSSGGGKIYNTLVYDNTVKVLDAGSNKDLGYALDSKTGETVDDIFRNCCSSVAYGANAQTTTVAPYDADYKLVAEKAASCINRGDNDYVTSELDLFGGTRIFKAKIVDIGCHEVQNEIVTLSASVAPVIGVDTLTPTFTATLLGGEISDYTCNWYFDGATEVSATGAVVKPTFTTVGYHSAKVQLMDGETLFKEQTLTDCVRVVPSVIEVTKDFDINAALQIAYQDGQTILVPEGTHVVTQQVALTAGIKVIGTGGFDKSVLRKRSNGDGKSYNGSVVKMTAPGAELRNVTIELASYDWGHTGAGGGIYMTTGRVERCVIRNCIGANQSDGGGIYMTGGVVTRSVITNNQLYCIVNNGSGAGVYMSGGRLDNSLVMGNRPQTVGTGSGGAVTLAGSTALLANCVIISNANRYAAGVSRGAGAGHVINNIIRDNHEQSTNSTNGAESNISYSLAYNYQTKKYTEEVGDVFIANCTPEAVGSKCVTADPQFTDPANGDFSIRKGGPCFRKGVYRDWMTVDFEGNARTNGLGRVDIGYLQSGTLGLGILIR